MASPAEGVFPKTGDHAAVQETSMSDAEKQSNPQGEELHRKLSARHLQFVAIGGTVGTGVFIASGGSIATAGPAGALLVCHSISYMVRSTNFSGLCFHRNTSLLRHAQLG